VWTVCFSREDAEDMRKVWQTQQWKFPDAQDATQSVARDLGADKTPHAFVLKNTPKGWFVMYEGAIDDNGARAR
jgi:hypothetical protein